MRIFLPLILVAALAACNSKNKSNGTSSNSTASTSEGGYVVASFEKPPAFGIFPVYKMWLYSNGTAKLEAIQHLKQSPGTYSAQLDEKILQQFVEKAQATDFFNLKEKYEGNATDLPLRKMTISSKNNESIKSVEFSQDFPQGLKELETMFDSLLDELDWKPI